MPRQNRYLKLLKSLDSKPSISDNQAKSHTQDNYLINWDNAVKSGLFSDQDIIDLDNKHKKQEEKKRNKKPKKEAVIWRINNAPQAAVQAAYHKALVGKKRG